MRQQQLTRRWAFLALLPMLLAACDGGGPSTTGDPSPFPVTVGTGDAAIEIPARPERIVSLSPTATEMLYAIGGGDQVVAVDANSDYPAGVPTTDLDGFAPNLEAVAGHDPDLVVAATDPGDLVSGLERLGIPALVLPAATTLDDTYTQLEQLGAATGHVADAAVVAGRIRADIETIVDSLPARARPLSYYHELDTSYYSVTSATFLGQLYGLLGMRSIADDAGGAELLFPQLSAEFIVDADPDVILLATAQCCAVDADVVASRPGWDQLTAVRQGRIIELDDDLASRWGPRVVDFLRTLADQLAILVPAS